MKVHVESEAPDSLSAVERVRERLEQAGRPEALRRFEESLRDLRLEATLERIAWTGGTDLPGTDPDEAARPCGLRLYVEGAVSGAFRLERDRVLLRLPDDPGVFVLDSAVDVTEEGPAGSIRAVLRNETGDHLLTSVGGLWFARAGDESPSDPVDPSIVLAFDVEVSIDPYDLPARGRWEAFVLVEACGWSGAIPVDLPDRSVLPPPALLPAGRCLSFEGTLTDRLRVDVDAPAGSLVGGWSPMPSDARLVQAQDGAVFELDVPLITASDASDAAGLEGHLVLDPRPGTPIEVPATLRGGAGAVGVLAATIPPHRLVRPEHYSVGLRVDGQVGSLGLDLELDYCGRTTIRPTEAVSVLGMDAIQEAHGEYVLIADSSAAPVAGALETLYAYARESRADVVVGRTAVGATRDETFRCNSRRCSMASVLGRPAIYHRSLLTGIPTNRLAATATMLLRARSIAVLADTVCFSPGNGEPASLHELAGALELIEEEPVRRHWLRHELLARLRGARFLDLSDAEQADVVEDVRKLLPRFSDSSIEALPLVPRVRADLAAAGRTEDLVHLAAWERSLTAHCDTSGAALSDGLLQWRGRSDPGGLPALPSTVSFSRSDLASDVELVLASQEDHGEFALPGDLASEIEVVADLGTAAAGRPLDSGLWRMYVRQVFPTLGVVRTAPVLDSGRPLAVLVDPLIGAELRVLHVPVVRQRRGLLDRLLNR